MLAEAQEQIATIPDDIAFMINLARHRHGKRSVTGDNAVKLAADQSWSMIQALPFVEAALAAWGSAEPLRVIRMLAVMICLCPEDHHEVVKYRLHPLMGECVENIAKQRLEQTLLEEWLS